MKDNWFLSFAKNAMSRDLTFKIVVLGKDGSMVYESSLETTEHHLMAHNAYFDNITGNLTVIGEFYDGDDKSQKAESKGIFARVLDKNGDEVGQSLISWDKDIIKKVAAEDKKEIKNYSMFFHNIIKAADGKILAVSEQYRKQVSAGGVAMKMAAGALGASTNASSLEIKIGKMIVIELNNDFTLSDVKIIAKKSNNIILSQDYGLVNQHVLAQMLKADGSFDYSYTQNNADNSIITVGYIDMEKVEGKGRLKAVFNALNYLSADGTYSTDKIVLETDASYLNVLPAKSGYVLITEYFRKRKTLSFRLEPLNL